MGRLVAIEGLDGAGKRTLVAALSAELTRRGASVARAAFPRYQADVFGPLLGDALRGRLGDLTDSVYGMALLFALDRRAAAVDLRAALAAHDLVLVDRYVASNAAYGAARLRQSGTGPFVTWVQELELGRFDLPRPDLQLLLRVPGRVAAARAAHRASLDTARARDAYESDDGLQRRCARVYDELAASAWLSPWRVLDGTGPATASPIAQLADELTPVR